MVRCGHVYEQREGAGKGWQGLESNEAHVALLCAHNAFHHRALARGDLQERAFARVPQGIHLVAFASLLAHYWHELGFRQRMSDGKFQQRKKKRKKKNKRKSLRRCEYCTWAASQIFLLNIQHFIKMQLHQSLKRNWQKFNFEVKKISSVGICCQF